MAWQVYAIMVVIAIYAYTQIPKPKPGPRPGIDSIKAPTVDTSRDIPVIFGTVDIRSPNIVWYGNLSTTAIKKSSGGK